MNSRSRCWFPISGTIRILATSFALLAAPALAADMQNGERLYAMHCASCHGASGVPDMPGAPDFKRGRVLLRPDPQVLQSIKRGRGAMPGYFGILTDREILDVIAYLRTLS